MAARDRRSRQPLDSSASPLEGLLEEMRDLRLMLAADLSAAAGAADAGADEVAADIVEGDRAELARFSRGAESRLLRLQRLAVADEKAPRWRRRAVVALPAVPVVGALAISAAAATGVLPLPHSAPHRPSTPVVADKPAGAVPVTSTFRHFVSVVGSHPNESQVLAAAHRLHRQLAVLIATSPAEPGQAAEIAKLLQMEQSLLLREQPPGVNTVLDATRRLAARLVHVAPELTSPSTPPPALPTTIPTHQPTHRPKATPSPSASPSTHRSTPAPQSSPSPHSSPSPSNPFPALPQ